MLKRFLPMAVFSILCGVGAVAHAADDTLPPQCQRLIKTGSNLIWKGCAGSGHLSKDPRGQGVALIAKRGTSLRVDSCMKIINPDGKVIGAMAIYPFNDPRAYAWRAYSNFGCGSGITRNTIKVRSKNGAIFIRTRARSKTCIKLSKSWQNINSSQRC